MSQYSETMGSFSRTSDYPLEANYVFSTEEALKEFYSDEINATTMHKGLLKVVEEDSTGSQSLWWVVKNESGQLEFQKLITFLDIPDLQEKIDDIVDTLEREIADRKKEDRLIKDKVQDLIDQLKKLKNFTDTLEEQLKATVGTDGDIIKYLETLPYKNLTEVIIAVHKFLETVDSENTEIQTLPELQKFLAGYTDRDNLKTLLEDLYNKIQGNPIPDEHFNTFRDIENAIKILIEKTQLKDRELQQELDTTQRGVGLEPNGNYSPDAYTYYLREATSVMNALRTLDALLYEVKTTTNLTPEDTETIDMTIRPYRDETVVSAKVKLSSKTGNQIIVEQDGIYHNVDFSYENGRLDVIVNGSIVKYFDLGLSGLVSDGYYDSNTENIVILLSLPGGETSKLTIPASELIEEWEILNKPESAVELHKDRNVAGKDTLSADIRISTDPKNILEKKNGQLLVKGTADNIRLNSGETVESKLGEISSNLGEYSNNINQLRDFLRDETNRAKEAEKALQDSITEETHNRETADQDLQNKIDNLSDKVSTNESNITGLQSQVSNLSESLTNEIHNRELSEQELQNQITSISDKVSTNETNIAALQEQSSNLETKLSEEINRAEKAEHAVEDLVIAEQNRAIGVEQGLQTSIDHINEILSLSDDTLAEKVAQVESNLSELSKDYNEHKVQVEKDKSDITNSITELSGKVDSNSTSVDELKQSVKNLTEATATETLRATEVEKDLKNEIDNLTERLNSNFDSDKSVTENLAGLSVQLSQEIDERKQADNTLQSNITAEETARTLADQDLQNKLDAIDTRVSTNETNISDLQGKTNDLDTKLSEEIVRAQKAEHDVEDKVTTEETERKAADAELANQIGVINGNVQSNAENISTLQSNLETVNSSIQAEVDRAKEAEQALKDAIRDAENTYVDTKSINFDKQGNVVTADVKVAGGTNIIKVDSDNEGIYATVDIGYNPVENKIWLETSGGNTKEIQLSEGNVIDDITYDVNEKALVITFTANGVQKTTKFPIADLFNDWTVSNPAEGSAIELTKVHNVKDPNAQDTPDTLSARLLIADTPNNAAQIIANGLFVSNKETVENTAAIADLQTKQSEFESKQSELEINLENEINRAQAKEDSLESAIENNKQVISNRVDNLETQLNTLDTNTQEALSKKIEKVELLSTDELTYTVLVDGNSIGTIKIPKDQFLQSVEQVGTALQFTFITTDGTTITNVDLKEVLGDLFGDVANVTKAIEDIKSQLQEEVNKIANAEAELQRQITNNSEKITEIISNTSDLSSTINQVNEKITQEIADRISSGNDLQSNITNLEHRQDLTEQNINSSIEQISKKIEDNTSAINTNKENILGLEKSIHDEEDRASKEEHRLEDLITGQNTVIDGLKEKVSEATAAVQDMKSSVDEAKTNAQEAKNLAQSFSQDITLLKQTTSELTESLAKEIQDRTKGDNDIKSSIEELKTQLEQIINQKLESLTQRVEAIEEALTWNKHEE